VAAVVSVPAETINVYGAGWTSFACVAARRHQDENCRTNGPGLDAWLAARDQLDVGRQEPAHRAGRLLRIGKRADRQLVLRFLGDGCKNAQQEPGGGDDQQDRGENRARQPTVCPARKESPAPAAATLLAASYLKFMVISGNLRLELTKIIGHDNMNQILVRIGTAGEAVVVICQRHTPRMLRIRAWCTPACDKIPAVSAMACDRCGAWESSPGRPNHGALHAQALLSSL
jgi:hypothetical protein